MRQISICIPTYEMNGLGHVFLRHSFEILKNQTFKDFDVVVSDHSKDNLIQNLCEEYKNTLDISYHRNTTNFGSSSANINNAIKNAHGTLIKVLFQDDFLYSPHSLEDIVTNFDTTKDMWLVTPSEHTTDGVHFSRPFFPTYNNNIHLGKNTMSSPSVLTIRNKNPLLFDEKLVWLMDCDYYKRCYNAYGLPKITKEINVVNRTGQHQVSNTVINMAIKIKELLYIRKKYAHD